MFVYGHYYNYHITLIIAVEQVNLQKADNGMIKYDKLWETMQARGITQYDLYTRYHMNRSQLNRLKHDKNVEVNTIDKLCNILDCKVEDIMTHYPDDNVF